MPRKIKTSNITTGAITPAVLGNTGVAAGNYGSSTNVPVITVNDKGQLTHITTAALPAGLATETYVNSAISNLVDSSPSALDTLNELAAALNDDANFASTVTTSLGNKVDKINITSGSVGSSTAIPVITYNAQGQITGVSTAALSLSTANWSIVEVSGELIFKYSGVNKFKITTAGAIVAVDNVTAYGSV